MRAIKGSITVLGWGEWEVGRDAGDTDRAGPGFAPD